MSALTRSLLYIIIINKTTFMEKSIHSIAAGILRKVLGRPVPAPTPGEEQAAEPATPEEKPAAETTN